MSELIPQPYTLPDAVKIGIASVVMTASELDNLISVALFRLASMPAANGFIIIGKMAVSVKMKKLVFLCDATMNDKFCEELDYLKERIAEFFDIRNAFCHGIYLGRNSKGLMFSLTADFSESESGYINKVFQIKEREVADAASKGKNLIGSFISLFGVVPWHESNPSKFVADKPKTRREIRKNDRTKRS